jgi:hypothetical protein
VKQLLLTGLSDGACDLCEPDARRKQQPVFVASADPLTWRVCGWHLAALIKAQDRTKGKEEPKAEAKNGPPAAQPAAK